jgi:photosystem II stability/assembly factor-like uncharacterized protein
MTRLTFTLLLLSALHVALTGQWQRQYPLSKLENVVDIDLTENGDGVAVGANATVLTKSAGGTEWFLRPEPVSGWDLVACDAAEGQNGQYLVVGGTGLAVSENGGANWQQVNGAPPGIKAVRILEPGVFIVVAASGVFRHDAGSWTSLGLPDASNVIGGEILDGDRIWCFTTGTTPVLYATANGGGMWSSTTDVPRPAVVRFYNANYGIAIDGRSIYHSLDGGVNWTLESENEIHTNVNDFVFGDNPGVVMAATRNGDPAISADSGRTWTQLDLDLINERNYSVAAVSDDEFYMGNDISSITRTTDAGASWTETSGPERRNINDIFFLDRNTGFAVGAGGKLLRTANGGAQWTDIGFETNRTYFTIAGTGTNNLWIGTNQRMLHSTDGGDTWTQNDLFVGGNINDVLAITTDLVLACATNGLILRTTDGGATWDTVYQAPMPNTQLRSIARMSGTRLMATGFNGVIVRSADNGATWAPVTVPEAGLQYEQTHFIGEEGWLITSSFKRTMWHTTNGGDAWTPLNLPVDRNWDGVYFITPDTGVVVGRSNVEGRAYLTFNGGANWQASYVTDFPLFGVSGVPNPNGTAWIHGFGSDIEVLPYCTTFPVLAEFRGDLFPCERDTVQYSVTGQDVDTYFWFFPPGWTPIGGTDDDTVTVVVGPNSGNISVTASNTCGLSNNISLQAGPTLLPVVTPVTGENGPCEGDIVQYSATATNVQDYNWIIPNGWEIVAGENTAEIQVLVGESAGEVAFVGANTCGSANATWPVTPVLRPRSLSLTGDETPCPGDTTLFTFDGQFATSVNWTFPDGWTLLNDPTGSTIAAIPGDNGTVTAAGVNACGQSAVLELSVTVEDVPSASLFVDGNNLFLTQEAAAYQWLLNNEPIPGATGETYTATVTGSYSCILTYASGCTTTTNAVNITITATIDPAIARGLRIHPSPARESIRIAGLTEACGYALTDMGGRILTRGVKTDETINIGHLVPGVYIIRLELPEGLGHLRFVKE